MASTALFSTSNYQHQCEQLIQMRSLFSVTDPLVRLAKSYTYTHNSENKSLLNVNTDDLQRITTRSKPWNSRVILLRAGRYLLQWPADYTRPWHSLLRCQLDEKVSVSSSALLSPLSSLLSLRPHGGERAIWAGSNRNSLIKKTFILCPDTHLTHSETEVQSEHGHSSAQAVIHHMCTDAHILRPSGFYRIRSTVTVCTSLSCSHKNTYCASGYYTMCVYSSNVKTGVFTPLITCIWPPTCAS